MLERNLFDGELRPYQHAAVKMARNYLAGFVSMQEHGCAVVCHPTGSGKTLVIAGITHFRSIGDGQSPSGALVLSPRAAIRDQLVVELSSRLFTEKLGFSEEVTLGTLVYPVRSVADFLTPAGAVINAAKKKLIPPAFHRFIDRQIEHSQVRLADTVLDQMASGKGMAVCTIQLLDELERNGGKAFDQLKESVGMVVFDEGHYEPARRWSQVIRALGRPVVLLTATPFRNDFRNFLVSKEGATYPFDIFHYDDAFGEFIRNVKILPRPKVASPASFVDDIEGVCNDQFGDLSAWPRVIICCSDHIKIIEIGEELIRRRYSVVGVHDQFRNPKPGGETPSWQYKDVPPPTETEAIFWLHQRKLLEGIDDPRFQVLAPYDSFRNGRELVQQIGRVLRKSPNSANKEETCFILDYFKGQIAADWAAFVEYDLALDEETLHRAMDRSYLYRAIFEKLSPVEYRDSRFRRKFDLNQFHPVMNDILVKRQVYMRRVQGGFDLERVCSSQLETLDDESIHVRCVYRDRYVAVILAIKEKSPDFLSASYFTETRHQIRVIAFLKDEGLVAVYDSEPQGLGPGLDHLPHLTHAELLTLSQAGISSRVVATSSRNTNLSNRVIRSRMVRAPSLGSVSPALDDHGHVLSNVTSWEVLGHYLSEDQSQRLNEDDFDTLEFAKALSSALVDNSSDQEAGPPVKRYVSMSTGRVSESGSQLRLPFFLAWLYQLSAQISTSSSVEAEDSDALARFASSGEVPDQPLAQNLLLDIYDIESEYWFVPNPDNGKPGDSSKPAALDYDDLCSDRKRVIDQRDQKSAVFNIGFNGSSFEVPIRFDSRKGTYRIDLEKDSDLDKRIRPRESNGALFSRRLNDLQSFSVLPEDVSKIFVHGRFYAPGIKFGSSFEASKFFVGKCLVPCKALEDVTSEKGKCVIDQAGNRCETAGRHYEPGSLFALIDGWDADIAERLEIDFDSMGITSERAQKKIERDIAFDPDLVICDDMDKESADFIIANEELGFVAIVHAKARAKRKTYSASVMQEVCAQAQKNSNLFSFFSLKRPPNFRHWHRRHRFKGLSVLSRMRKPYNIKKDIMWERLEQLLLNPQTEKEIWIVVGNMLSHSAISSTIRSDTPAPEAIQLNHLVETTIANTASLGAKLRIFCMP